MRYKLTDTQKQSLGQAQIQLNQAQQVHEQAQGRLNEVMALVFDAHGLDSTKMNGASVDVETWEIITPDKPKKKSRKDV